MGDSRSPDDVARGDNGPSGGGPRGSSSGSASAVAQGLCDSALGTDTGGSVRALQLLRPLRHPPDARPAQPCGMLVIDEVLLRRVGERTGQDRDRLREEKESPVARLDHPGAELGVLPPAWRLPAARSGRRRDRLRAHPLPAT